MLRDVIIDWDELCQRCVSLRNTPNTAKQEDNRNKLSAGPLQVNTPPHTDWGSEAMDDKSYSMCLYIGFFCYVFFRRMKPTFMPWKLRTDLFLHVSPVLKQLLYLHTVCWLLVPIVFSVFVTDNGQEGLQYVWVRSLAVSLSIVSCSCCGWQWCPLSSHWNTSLS